MAEAKKWNIAVLPPDINASGVMFEVEVAKPEPVTTGSRATASIRYALAAIKNVGAGAMAAIVAEREAHGPFKDIHDFANRVDASVMNRRQLEYLAMAGAFDSLVSNRRQVLESLDVLIASAQNATQERSSSQVSLFGGQESQALNRRELKPVKEWPLIEKLNHECAGIGFDLSSHPLEPYGSVFKKLGVSPSTRLASGLSDKQALRLAGILTASKLRSSPRGRSAFLTLSDAHGQYEVAVFDEMLLNQHHALLKNGTPLLLGIDVRNGERGQRLLVTRIEALDQVAQGVRANLVKVMVEDVEALTSLKQALGEPRDRGARVELSVQVPGGVVKQTSFETDDYKIYIEDATAIDAWSKLKVRVFNKTNDYLILKPTDVTFKIDGKEIQGTDKQLIIVPNDEASQVIDVKGPGCQVDYYSVSIKTLYKVAANSPAVKAEDFVLPVAKR